MSGRVNRGSPEELARLAQRFATWRRSRAFGTRIPEPLWDAAVALAVRHGLSRTAMALKLGYYALKKRVEQAASARQSAEGGAPHPAFVELPAGSLPGPGECVIEFEKSGGARMRVHLKGAGIPDLVALARSFWGSP